MALSINWATFVITVLQADLTFVSGTLYELDTDAFRLELKAIEASPIGINFPDTHKHSTEVVVAGTTFARALSIINGYSVEFEPGLYSVRLVNSNNDIWDIGNGILVQNTVQVIPTNSAGLIVGDGADPTDIADAVWSKLLSGFPAVGSAGKTLADVATNAVTASEVSIEVWSNEPVGDSYSKRDQFVYDANGFPLSARERLFPTKADAEAGTNVLHTFTITATPDGVETRRPATFDRIKDV